MTTSKIDSVDRGGRVRFGLGQEERLRIARNTQIIIQEESQICRVVDPLGGSYYIESLTKAIVDEAQKIIDEVEEMGGMTRAVEAGIPKMRIEEAAARRQARIDRGEDRIVGVNCYELEEEPDVDILDIDNSAVRESQIERIRQVREARDPAVCKEALQALEQGARDGSGCLLSLSIEAARARETALARELGDRRLTGVCLRNIGALLYRRDEFEAAREPLAEALALARETGDRRGEGLALWGFALCCRATGDPPRARARLRRRKGRGGAPRDSGGGRRGWSYHSLKRHRVAGGLARAVWRCFS